MPTNEYFDSISVPANNAFVASNTIRAEFNAVEDGFKKLPVLASNANLPIFVNGGATALEAKAVAAARSALGVTASSAIAVKNGILNGIPLVWQDGTSFTSIANAAYIADNYQYSNSSAMVHNATQDASYGIPTIAEAGVTVRCLR